MNHHILVIDDDKNELRKLRQLLSREGYSIMTATDKETALSLCKSFPIKYILGDSEYFKLNNEDDNLKENQNKGE